MKVGLALGAGGAKGFAHIGVLKALDEAGIEISAVAGTSIGALVGSVYLSGKLAELEEFAVGLSITDVARLLGPVWAVSGMFSGSAVLERLEKMMQGKSIEDLDRPFAAVAVDLASGEKIVYRRGPLINAVRSSFSIPVIFTPVVQDAADGAPQQVAVDGGVIDPVPVSVCRTLGVDKVIAVDLFGNYQPIDPATTSPTGDLLWRAALRTAGEYFQSVSAKLPLGARLFPADKAAKKPLNIIEISERSFALMQRELTSRSLSQDPPDFTIAPPTLGFTLLDFHRASPLIERAAEMTRKMIPQIKELIKV